MSVQNDCTLTVRRLFARTERVGHKKEKVQGNAGNLEAERLAMFSPHMAAVTWKPEVTINMGNASLLYSGAERLQLETRLVDGTHA